MVRADEHRCESGGNVAQDFAHGQDIFPVDDCSVELFGGTGWVVQVGGDPVAHGSVPFVVGPAAVVAAGPWIGAGTSPKPFDRDGATTGCFDPSRESVGVLVAGEFAQQLVLAPESVPEAPLLAVLYNQALDQVSEGRLVGFHRESFLLLVGLRDGRWQKPQICVPLEY